MTEALKDIYSEQFLDDFCQQIIEQDIKFEAKPFIQELLTKEWPALTVRQRMKKIAQLLGKFLSGTYEDHLPLLLALHQQNRGFAYLFFPDYIGIYGLAAKDFDLSLSYLKQMTAYSSSEFAIREFIAVEPKRVLKLLLTWSEDPDDHVRRLASEGCRPLLPWGSHLDYLISRPELALPILTNLKADPSLYVRKSVANHLNDMSKNHQKLVIDTCRHWYGKDERTDWIVKKACRTLVKNADPDALKLFGYEIPGQSFHVLSASINMAEQQVTIGEKSHFSYSIATTISNQTPIRLEYGIDYVKANGKTSMKKFYLTDSLTSKDHFHGKKTISFKNLSTRIHYPGEHSLTLFLNGQVIAQTSFSVIQ